ncbi:unnamed protein product, partial [Vitis vinifera]|uniref:Uncharacterized protein n=1 Tax=Vitis vinifera TaxID=29760 RepID=D7TEU5_VITVI
MCNYKSQAKRICGGCSSEVDINSIVHFWITKNLLRNYLLLCILILILFHLYSIYFYKQWKILILRLALRCRSNVIFHA